MAYGSWFLVIFLDILEKFYWMMENAYKIYRDSKKWMSPSDITSLWPSTRIEADPLDSIKKWDESPNFWPLLIGLSLSGASDESGGSTSSFPPDYEFPCLCPSSVARSTP